MRGPAPDGPAQAIPTWQRLGATFGSDTNAETTPTQTVYKLDLPNASPQEVADLLDINVRTVNRDWHKARAWLSMALRSRGATDEGENGEA